MKDLPKSVLVLFCKSILNQLFCTFPISSIQLAEHFLYSFLIFHYIKPFCGFPVSVLMAFCSKGHQKSSPGGKADGLHACMVCMHVLKSIVLLGKNKPLTAPRIYLFCSTSDVCEQSVALKEMSV